MGKIGQRLPFNEALKTHVAKYRKAGSPYAWAQRDEIAEMPLNLEAQADFNLKVSPFIESVTESFGM